MSVLRESEAGMKLWHRLREIGLSEERAEETVEEIAANPHANAGVLIARSLAAQRMAGQHAPQGGHHARA